MTFEVEIKEWRAVASWTWNAGDDVCGICRNVFDSCSPEAKFPGDDCPVVWGVCSHAFHLPCINQCVFVLVACQLARRFSVASCLVITKYYRVLVQVVVLAA